MVNHIANNCVEWILMHINYWRWKWLHLVKHGEVRIIIMERHWREEMVLLLHLPHSYHNGCIMNIGGVRQWPETL